MSNIELILVRHGNPLGKDVDPNRGLSPTGRKQAQNIGRLLAEKIDVDRLHIFHSGKDRARQTAEMIAEQLGDAVGEISVDARSGLKPNDDVLPVVDWLTGGPQSIMIVGHLPFLSDLLQQLIGNAVDNYRFEECRAAGLTRIDGKFELKFFEDPPAM